jgi:hypothetical protein
VAIFLVTGIYQPPLVNGEGITDDTIDDTGDNEQEPGDSQEKPIIPQELSQPSQDSVSIIDKIEFTVSSSPVTPRGFVPGIPIERGGGGGNGNAGGDEDEDTQEEPLPTFDAIVRVEPDPVPSPGMDIQAFGITNASSATHAIFELFGPECPQAAGISCAIELDSSQLAPPSFTSVPSNGLCSSDLCEEYSVVFPGEHLDIIGEYHLKVSFFDTNDNVVAIKGMNFRVHSFFVVPESQFGAIALIVSSLGTLVFVYFVKIRRR